jgi:hypothetical protein
MTSMRRTRERLQSFAISRSVSSTGGHVSTHGASVSASRICRSNEVYVTPMAEALNTAAQGRAEEIKPGWFGRWFIRTYIEPTTQKAPHRAPSKIIPIATQLDFSILERFIASNVEIRRVADRARRYDVNAVRFRNPFVPVIRFTVGTGLLIIARHNHRHLLQAERVRRSADFPTEHH